MWRGSPPVEAAEKRLGSVPHTRRRRAAPWHPPAPPPGGPPRKTRRRTTSGLWCFWLNAGGPGDGGDAGGHEKRESDPRVEDAGVLGGGAAPGGGDRRAGRGRGAAGGEEAARGEPPPFAMRSETRGQQADRSIVAAQHERVIS